MKLARAPLLRRLPLKGEEGRRFAYAFSRSLATPPRRGLALQRRDRDGRGGYRRRAGPSSTTSSIR